MEERLTEVEKAIVRIDVTLNHIAAKLDDLGNLKLQFIIGCLTIIIAVIATAIGIQQMTVSTFRAAADTVAQPSPPQPIIIMPPSSAPAAPAVK